MLQQLDILSAFTVGLMGSLHCVGMCGGISAALTNAVPNQSQQGRLTKLLYQSAYNCGRITSYALAGAMVGFAGAALYHQIAPTNLYGLRIFAGIMLILLGLYLSNWWKFLTHIERLGQALWRRISPLTKRFIPVDNPLKAYALGILWGWLPCGLVYSALALSLSSGSAAAGALTMIAFGLGTFPALLSIGYFSQLFRTMAQSNTARALAGLLLIAYGIWIIISVFSGTHEHHHH